MPETRPRLDGRASGASRSIVMLSLTITVIVGAFVLHSAFGWPGIFKNLIARHDWPAAWCMLFVLLVMLVDWRDRGITRSWITWLSRNPLQLAGMVLIALAAGSLVVYRNFPLCMDEFAAWFQARVFAEGHLSGHFPPELLDWLVPRQFQNQFLTVNRATGEIASAYWPGFSLLLTPFTWMGIPWLCNPVIVAASLLVIWKLAAELFEQEEARGWAMLLALASPAFLVNGISYYSMSAHLLFNLIFTLLLLRPTPARAFFAGVVGSWALVLHNPLPHLLFAIPWIVWLALNGRKSATSLAALFIGYLPLSIVLGLAWRLWLGEMAYQGITTAVSATSTASPSTFVDTVLRLATVLLRQFAFPGIWLIEVRLLGLAKLWLWAVPALLTIVVMGWRGYRRGPLAVMAASAILTIAGYLLVPYDQGHGWGYRYFHSAWGILPVLGAGTLVNLTGANIKGAGLLQQRILLGGLLSLFLLVPLRFYQVGDFVDEHLNQMPPRVTADKQVVILRGAGYYPYDLVQNDPWLRGNRTMMISSGSAEQDERAVASYLPGCRKIAENDYGWVCGQVP